MKPLRKTLVALTILVGIFILALLPVTPSAAAGCGGGWRYPARAYYGAWGAYPYVDYHSGYYRSYYPSVPIYSGPGYRYDGYRPSISAYSYGLYGWGAAPGYTSYCY